ncbi:hypothetical protein CGZ92_03670 [Parenemella sanctibonifatiensis]|uniref:Uncharacterized protein n=2 Tax=Parenemella sanctibonifatiensis TaxID=2016505 RepID=A0A255EB56_9ACTN|nr:hypothetical protein CGZ92_03670 [Parenemella sanctibonifatiensis]
MTVSRWKVVAAGADRKDSMRTLTMPATGRAARSVVVLLALALALLAPLLAAAPAHAQTEEGERGWRVFSLLNGQWNVTQDPPSMVVPADGAVLGLRFSAAPTDAPREPRAQTDVEAACGSVPISDDAKRVVVLIDFGAATDAPEGAEPPREGSAVAYCKSVDPGATAAQVFEDLGRIDVQDESICAVQGYPAEGCGEPASGPFPQEPEEEIDVQAGSGGWQQPRIDEENVPGSAGGILSFVLVALILGGVIAAAFVLRRNKGKAAGGTASAPAQNTDQNTDQGTAQRDNPDQGATTTTESSEGGTSDSGSSDTGSDGSGDGSAD